MKLLCEVRMAGRPREEEKAVPILVKATEEYRRIIKSEAARRGMTIAEYTRYLMDLGRNLEAQQRGA